PDGPNVRVELLSTDVVSGAVEPDDPQRGQETRSLLCDLGADDRALVRIGGDQEDRAGNLRQCLLPGQALRGSWRTDIVVAHQQLRVGTGAKLLVRPGRTQRAVPGDQGFAGHRLTLRVFLAH